MLACICTFALQMETDEQPSSESNVKENGETEKIEEKSPEEEIVSAPAVKHLEENQLFSQYYLVCIWSVGHISLMFT